MSDFRMCRDFAGRGEKLLIERMFRVLKDLASSTNPNYRKGGLIGLAAMAIGLGVESKNYVHDLMEPILRTLCDHDSRVRYYGSEACYNVVKILREECLILFCELFDALSQITADPEPTVRKGAETLDRLVKDIVSESESFKLESFIPLLRERMYTLDPFARQFIVSWVQFLQDVPHFNVVKYLPELLDGLLRILEDSNPEIRTMCSNVLQDFLNEIRDTSRIDFSALVNILLVRTHASEEAVQYTALSWLKEFVNLAGSGSLLLHSAALLSAILPRLADSPSTSRDDGVPDVPSSPALSINIREVARTLNYSLMQLLTMDDQDLLDIIGAETDQGPTGSSRQSQVFDFTSIIEVLKNELNKTSTTSVKLAVLSWFQHLLSKVPGKVIPRVEEDILPVLVDCLKDSCDKVVLNVYEVLALIFANTSDPQGVGGGGGGGINPPISRNSSLLGENSISEKFFRQSIHLIIQLFAQDLAFLERRGSFIVTNLCIRMNSEDVFRSLSEILRNHEDIFFAQKMVQTLNLILLTSTELHELRSLLRDLRTDESCSLFCCLYRTWCHSPVATVSLCLLTKNYKHASRLVVLMGDLEVTVQFLVEIDQLVQLVESPIFACEGKFSRNFSANFVITF